jgi:hypothetical protein
VSAGQVYWHHKHSDAVDSLDIPLNTVLLPHATSKNLFFDKGIHYFLMPSSVLLSARIGGMTLQI